MNLIWTCLGLSPTANRAVSHVDDEVNSRKQMDELRTLLAEIAAPRPNRAAADETAHEVMAREPHASCCA